MASGHTGVDTYATFIRWEVYQPSPDSPKSVMRRSFAFKWIKKQPQLIGSMYKQVAKDRDSAMNDLYWQTFFPNSIDLLQLEQEQGKPTGPTPDEKATFDSAKGYVDSKLGEYTEKMNAQVKSLDLQCKILAGCLIFTVLMICCMCPYICVLRRREHLAKMEIVEDSGVSLNASKRSNGTETSLDTDSEL